jgi:hypothetical protein
LGNPVTSADNEVLSPEIGQDNLDFASIVRINGTGRIKQPHVVVDRQPTSGSNLRLKA